MYAIFSRKLLTDLWGTSETQIVEIFRSLPSNDDTKKVFALCIMAAMKTRSSVDAATKASKIIMPEDLMIGDKVNMTVLATIGHLQMTASDSEMTEHGLARKVKYRQSIGGAKDIRAFTIFRDASTTRTTILRKYADNISAYDTNLFLRVAKPKLPVLFKVGVTGRVTRMITGSFSTFFNIIWSIVKMALILMVFMTAFRLSNWYKLLEFQSLGVQPVDEELLRNAAINCYY